MLLYERLIGPNHPRDPSLAPMREDFAAAVLVVVDNVAHFYFESPPGRLASGQALSQYRPTLAEGLL